MKRWKLWFAIVTLLSCSAGLWAQAEKSGTPAGLGQEFDKNINGLEKEFVSAVEAMPEDKFSFAPTNGEFKGVRTFSEQAKHVAAVNYMIAAGILGEKVPVDINGEKGPDSYTSKADIVKFVKDSFTYVHKALSSISEKNALELAPSPFGKNKVRRVIMAGWIGGHSFDHYGQMVEYLRMNGIVPPGSRPQ